MFKNPELPGLKILKTKKNARDFLTALIAITSDGQKVTANFSLARQLYEGIPPDRARPDRLRLWRQVQQGHADQRREHQPGYWLRTARPACIR
jgi:hypothetical protein